MNSITVEKILTHENPDMDAIVSVLLLKRFGEERLPGVKNAEVVFYSAGKLPEGKTPEELENEGILAVDIGGGRFDTHPVDHQIDGGKRERCATDLVAEAVGVLDKPGWKELIEYTRQHDVEGRNVLSTDYIHHLPTVLTILSGFHILFDNESAKSETILSKGMHLLEAVPVYVEKKSEEDGFDSLTFMKEIVDRYISKRGVNVEEPPPEFESFVEWRRRLNEDPENAFSKDSLDEILSLLALTTGFWYTEGMDKEKVWKRLELCFDAIIARETRWVGALNEFDKEGYIYEVGKKTHIVRIASEEGLVIKAARFRSRADLVIYREPKSGATSFLIKRKGPLNKFSMGNLAAKVRIAECIEEGNRPDYTKLKEVGTVHGWFLHQSENLLIRGSLKADDFVPTKISMEDLAEIAVSEADWEQRIPLRYCPDHRCLRRSCLFYRLHAATCRNHRKRLSQAEPKSILGEKLLQALEAKSKERR